MIVIHIDTMEDTARLRRAYDGLDNVTLLYNPSRKRVEKELRTNNDRVVMLLGHGSRYGLFNRDWSGYIIDGINSNLLQDRLVIGIWCYASEFADRCGLHGYFTSMFISNMGEALALGFPNNEENDIFAEIDYFCDQIHDFIATNTEMATWVDILKESCHIEKDFVRFNYEAMAFYD